MSMTIIQFLIFLPGQTQIPFKLSHKICCFYGSVNVFPKLSPEFVRGIIKDTFQWKGAISIRQILTLWTRISKFGPAKWMTIRGEECVFLLNAKPWMKSEHFRIGHYLVTVITEVFVCKEKPFWKTYEAILFSLLALVVFKWLKNFCSKLNTTSNYFHLYNPSVFH